MGYKKAISELKLMTVKREQDLAALGDYFFTHIAEDPEVMPLGKPVKAAELKFYRTLLQPVLDTYFPTTITVQNFMLLEIKKAAFLHGTLMMSNFSTVAMYFYKDIQIGLAVVCDGGPQVHFCRLTVWSAPADSVHSDGQFVAAASKTTH